MELESSDNYCFLCWQNFQVNSHDLDMSFAPVSPKHFQIWNKYLKLEIHNNWRLLDQSKALICAGCSEASGKLYELNGQLEEIENVLNVFARQMTEIIKKSREDKVIIRNIDTNHFIIHEPVPVAPKNVMQGTEINDDTKPTLPFVSHKAVEWGDTSRKYASGSTANRTIKIEPLETELAEESVKTKSKTEVRVTLKRLQFRLQGEKTSNRKDTVVVLGDNWNQNHSTESIEGWQDVQDPHFIEREDRSSDGDNEGAMNGFTVSYRCSRCCVTSSDRSTMEQHIRIHEKRDSEYWLKNLKFLKRIQSIRRRVYT